MPLLSRLFKADKRLATVEVDDAAHLTLGAKGEHVSKVQLALQALHWLDIDRRELVDHVYGRSTAAAVLAYKTKRQIINRSYQGKPDDIVGKMTIAQLDREMLLWELSQQHRGDCRCGSSPRLDPQALAAQGGSARLSFAIPASAATVDAGRPAPLPQLGRALRIYCSITRRALLEDGFALAEHINKARDLIMAYGMSLSPEFGRANGQTFADTIDFPLTVDREQVPLIRQASENTRPGSPSILRIIVCKRHPNEGPGETFRDITVGGTTFPAFVLLNSSTPSRDHSTLLHEMVHAAYPRRIEPIHDEERHSVLFQYSPVAAESPDRNWLKPDRAVALSKGYFAV